MKVNDKVKVKVLNKYWVQGKVLKVVEGDIDYLCIEVPTYYGVGHMPMYIEVPVNEVIKIKKEKRV